MSDKSIAYEKRRYARDRKKRIAAETRYKAKKKSDPAYRQKVKARSKVQTAKRNGTAKPPATCPNCGRKAKLDWHHINYKTGAGYWRCSRCHPHGGAARGAKKGGKT